MDTRLKLCFQRVELYGLLRFKYLEIYLNHSDSKYEFRIMRIFQIIGLKLLQFI